MASPPTLSGKQNVRNAARIVATLCASLMLSASIINASFAQQLSRDHVLAPHDPAHAAEPGTWCAVHVGKNELVQALSDCTYALSRDPDDVQAMSNRGSLYLIAKDPKAALSDFERAIALKPGVATLHFNRGVAHSDLGNAAAAIADYSEAIRLRPEFEAALHNRGWEHEKLGDTKRAIADYEAALRIKPDLAPTLKRLEGLRRSL